jgi:hypothetical protein
VSDTIDPEDELADADQSRMARPTEQGKDHVTEIQAAVNVQGAPEDLRDLLEGLAADGISATLPTAGPNDPLHEPLVVRTSLSAAITEEREE